MPSGSTKSGSAIRGTENYGAMISEIYKRLYSVEQLASSPLVMGGGGSAPPDNSVLIIDDGVHPPVVLDLYIGDVQNLVLTTSTLFDDVYVDANWDAPDPNTEDGRNLNGYEVSYRKRTNDTPAYTWDAPTLVYAPGTSQRVRNLEPNKVYEFSVWAISTSGVRSGTPAVAQITTLTDSTVPPPVTGVVLARGATSAIVYYTPLTTAQAPDVANGNGTYLVQLSTDPAFGTIYREMRTSASVVQFGDISSELVLYARVAPTDTSANQGAWAYSTGLAAGGVIESMIFGTLTGNLITVNTLDGDRIVGNTVIANKLTASTFTSGQIILAGGGSFWVPGTGSAGLLINSLGLRLYDISGNIITSLDSSGNAAFTGAISASTVDGTNITGSTITGGIFQTNSSGQRIVMSSGFSNTIQFSSSSLSETAPGVIKVDDNGSASYVLFRAPRTSEPSDDDLPKLQLTGRDASGAPWGKIALDARSNYDFIAVFNTQGSTGTVGVQLSTDGVIILGSGGATSIYSGGDFTVANGSQNIHFYTAELYTHGHHLIEGNCQVNQFMNVLGNGRIVGDFELASGSAYGSLGGGYAFTFLEYYGQQLRFVWDGTDLIVYIGGDGYYIEFQ